MPQDKLPPVSYYPSTVIFVDDEESFLKALDLKLRFQKNFTYKLYSNPDDAIAFLNQQQSKEKWLDNFIVVDDEASAQHDVLKFDVDKLILRTDDASRFNDVTVIITDYKMPNKYGTEFLDAVDNKFILRIILSGMMEPEKTYEAFNERVINKYISKTAANAHELILKFIHEAQENYFASLTNELIKYSPRMAVILANPEFYKFLQKVVKQYNAVEYYLIDEYGSYLLFDADGKATMLAVRHAEELEDYLDYISYEDEPPKPELVESLKNKTKFPFFFNMVEPEVAEWDKYMVDAKLLEGTQIYYSIIEDVSRYDLPCKNMKSFSEFKKEQKK